MLLSTKYFVLKIRIRVCREVGMKYTGAGFLLLKLESISTVKVLTPELGFCECKDSPEMEEPYVFISFFPLNTQSGKPSSAWECRKGIPCPQIHLWSPSHCLTSVSCTRLLTHICVPNLIMYRSEAYNIFENNCNTFSNEVAQFLTGRKIPSYITDLPSEILST